MYKDKVTLCLKHFELKSILSLTQQIFLRKCLDYRSSLTQEFLSSQTLLYMVKLNVKLSCGMDFTDYPHDTQVIHNDEQV